MVTVPLELTLTPGVAETPTVGEVTYLHETTSRAAGRALLPATGILYVLRAEGAEDSSRPTGLRRASLSPAYQAGRILIRLELGGSPRPTRGICARSRTCVQRRSYRIENELNAQRLQPGQLIARRGATAGVVAQARRGLREQAPGSQRPLVETARAVMRASRSRSCSRSGAGERPDAPARTAADARALRSSTSRRPGLCELDPHGPAVGRDRVSPRRRGRGRPGRRPCGSPWGRSSRSAQPGRSGAAGRPSAISISAIRWVAVIAGPSSGAAGHAGELAQQLPELLEDHRRVR